MPEPGGAPGLAEVVRRWSDTLADTDGVNLSADGLSELVDRIARDASAAALAARDAALRRFTALFSTLPIGVALADSDGHLIEANHALGTFLGLKPEQLRGRHLVELGLETRDTNSLRAGLEELAETDADAFTERVQLAHAEGGGVWAEVKLDTLPGDRPGRLHPVLMVTDANEVHSLQETLRRQNIGDRLTGLTNVIGFTTALERALAPSARDQIALIYLDVDGFKVINDGLGADVADDTLRRIARTLERVFAGPDAVVARLSGDGFGVLLRGKLIASDVITLVEEALEELAEPVYRDDAGIGISASVGIVVRDVAGGQLDDLRRAAEIALHRAKEAGKAQWVLFDAEQDARDRARYRLAAQMAGALESGEFEVTYNPTVTLPDQGRIVAVTAGLRWRHPERGEIPADEFFPLADITGMTMPLGRWLLTESVGAAADWLARHPGKAPDVCVRLPRRVAIDPELVLLVKNAMQRHDLPAGSVRLCTESSALADPRSDLPETLSVLQDLGVKLVLMIEGSADLELIATHGLQIRHGLLAGAVVDAVADGEPAPAARHLEHLVTRARELGLRLGAEGVVNDEQAGRLAAHGIVAARGPWVGENLNADEIGEMLSSRA